MKKIIALLLVLVIATLCACGNQETPTKKKKKKIVYIQREPTSSVDDSASGDEESDEDTMDEDYYIDDDTSVDEEDYETDDSDKEENSSKPKTETIENTVTTTTAIKKITSQNIGKNYYVFKPKEEHPGVADLDAYYEMIAMDKRGRTLNVEDMVIECSDTRVKLNGNILTIPYSVRASGDKLTVSMYDKKSPNLTGSFTFNFAVQFTEKPTFLDEFDTLDTTVWKDDWYADRMPIEDLYCENGELVMYATEETNGIELSTTGTFRQAYGSFSARIKMPTSGLTGMAFWLCTEKGIRYIKNPQRPTQSGGEIDIVEFYPTWGDHKTSCTVHWNGWSNYHIGEGSEPIVKQKLRGEFHVYSCVWTSTAIYFYLDEDLIWTYRGDGVAPNSGPMQLLLQHANPKADNGWGGKYDPAELPNESRWDYVKVYGLASE